ncbi:hypothetical protein [Mesomycoplasma neurolyticum]|uniref:Lipoprotein n=1 Tax=Mesomycoplasma neurolyticum TaxID=2120 RepID=A0A449A5J6_9BACT|nr:hypothetical protein [Mesomycoplasma neurolyticum]VEU59508.1 Uncharacterised protein [Mesomycoplasma neurolyticum]
MKLKKKKILNLLLTTSFFIPIFSFVSSSCASGQTSVEKKPAKKEKEFSKVEKTILNLNQLKNSVLFSNFAKLNENKLNEIFEVSNNNFNDKDFEKISLLFFPNLKLDKNFDILLNSPDSDFSFGLNRLKNNVEKLKLIDEIMKNVKIPNFYKVSKWSDILKEPLEANKKTFDFYKEFLRKVSTLWKKYFIFNENSKNIDKSIIKYRNWKINSEWDKEDAEWFLNFNIDKDVYFENLNNEIEKYKNLKGYKISERFETIQEENFYKQLDFIKNQVNKSEYLLSFMDEMELFNPLVKADKPILTLKELSENEKALNEINKIMINEPLPSGFNYSNWKEFIISYKSIAKNVKEIFDKYITYTDDDSEFLNDEIFRKNNYEILLEWNSVDKQILNMFIPELNKPNNHFRKYYIISDVSNQKNKNIFFLYFLNRKIREYLINSKNIKQINLTNEEIERNFLFNIVTSQFQIKTNNDPWEEIKKTFFNFEIINPLYVEETENISNKTILFHELFLEKNKEILNELNKRLENVYSLEYFDDISLAEKINIYKKQADDVLNILKKYVFYIQNDVDNNKYDENKYLKYSDFVVNKIWDAEDYQKIWNFKKYLNPFYESNVEQEEKLYNKNHWSSSINKYLHEEMEKKLIAENKTRFFNDNELDKLKIINEIKKLDNGIIKNENDLNVFIKNALIPDILNLSDKTFYSEKKLNEILANKNALEKIDEITSHIQPPRISDSKTWKEFLIKYNEISQKSIEILKKYLIFSNEENEGKVKIQNNWEVSDYYLIYSLNSMLIPTDLKSRTPALASYSEIKKFHLPPIYWNVELNSIIENAISFEKRYYEEDLFKNLDFYKILDNYHYTNTEDKEEIYKTFISNLKIIDPKSLYESKTITFVDAMNDEEIIKIIKNIKDLPFDLDKEVNYWDNFFIEQKDFFDNLKNIISKYVFPKKTDDTNQDEYIKLKNFIIKKQWSIKDYEIVKKLHLFVWDGIIKYNFNKYIENQSIKKNITRQYSKDEISSNLFINSLSKLDKQENNDYKKAIGIFDLIDPTGNDTKTRLSFKTIWDSREKKLKLIQILNKHKIPYYHSYKDKYTFENNNLNWENLINKFYENNKEIQKILTKYITNANENETDDEEHYIVNKKLKVKKNWLVKDFIKLSNFEFIVLESDWMKKILSDDNFDTTNYIYDNNVPLIYTMNEIIQNYINNNNKNSEM